MLLATRPTFTLCFRDSWTNSVRLWPNTFWPPVILCDASIYVCAVCCVFLMMNDPTNFVSLSGRTHSGLQRFFAKPSFIFVLCFGNNDHTFSWVDWKWHVLRHAPHTIHQQPREFSLQRTVSSSCNLARVEGTLQCKDDQRPHLFSLLLGSVW